MQVQRTCLAGISYYIADIHHQDHGYDGLTGIGNVLNDLQNSLVVPALLNLGSSAKELQNFYYRVISYMIAKAIKGSITKTSLDKLIIRQGGYEWTDDEGLISNDGPNILYLLFKIINPATRIGVSNLIYGIEKGTRLKII